jgi:hypothetical protein
MEEENKENVLSEVTDAAVAIAKTITNPTTQNFVDDLQLAIKLVKRLKIKIENMHPDVNEIVRKLL